MIPVVKIVRLPDGRWAVENGEGVGELTLDDLNEISHAFGLWLSVHWNVKAARQ
jgi:hypothetical protein